MRPYVQSPHVVQHDERVQLLRSFEENLLIGKSPLRGPFRDTRGVAWTFTLPGLTQLLGTCPWLDPALSALALRGPAQTTSRFPSFPRRPPFNAFYLNLLEVGAGEGVAAHLDTTLRETVNLPKLFPNEVSVLWLTAPPTLVGGELRLFKGSEELATLPPSPGDVVHFNGRLLHQILPIEHIDDSTENNPPRRISLICEKYRVPQGALHKVPSLKRHARGLFSRYLKRARARPPKPFEADSPAQTPPLSQDNLERGFEIV